MTKKSKITYLTLGIGIGIIITSTFYSFFPQIELEELSDDIITERAIDLGMINLKESINIVQPQKEKNDEEKSDKDKEQIPIEELYIQIIVDKGEVLQDIADKLFTLELIDNKEEFILLAEDKMRDRLFSYGTYDIKMNTSYSTIIKILTKNK